MCWGMPHFWPLTANLLGLLWLREAQSGSGLWCRTPVSELVRSSPVRRSVHPVFPQWSRFGTFDTCISVNSHHLTLFGSKLGTSGQNVDQDLDRSHATSRRLAASPPMATCRESPVPGGDNRFARPGPVLSLLQAFAYLIRTNTPYGIPRLSFDTWDSGAQRG